MAKDIHLENKIASMRKHLGWALDKHAHKVMELTTVRDLEKRLREYCTKKIADLNAVLAQAGLPPEDITPPSRID